LHPPKKIPNMKIKTLIFPAFLLFFISCKKSETSNTNKYLTTSAGSTWNYHETDSSDLADILETDYTLSSTSQDSSINGRNYHVFNNSSGGNQYLNNTGNDYYEFDSLPTGLGISIFERLYLKDNISVGAIWTQILNVTLPGVPIPVPSTLTYTIVEKGVSRSVNGTNYTNVIHVATSISSSLIPSSALTTSINSYYAQKYGLIESANIVTLDFQGTVQNINIETKLVNATLL
jgi:hypothetical protein